MEERPQARKGHFWLGLSVGLLTGILLACAFYFLDKYTSLEMLRFQRENTESAATDTVVQIVESPVRTKKPSRQNDTLAPDVTATSSDSTDIGSTDDFDEYETDDLMMELDEETKPVVKTKGIASRRVRVISSNDIAGTASDFEFFDVEEWSEPVKNRHSYQRKGNTLRVKGVSINAIEIEWTGEKYLLRFNGHAYPIPENAEFTRLTE